MDRPMNLSCMYCSTTAHSTAAGRLERGVDGTGVHRLLSSVSPLSEAALGLSLFARTPTLSVHIITRSPQGFSIGSSQCTQLGKPVSLYKRVRLLWRHRQDLPQLLVLVKPPYLLLSIAFNQSLLRQSFC
jgi:hypothetical protein